MNRKKSKQKDGKTAKRKICRGCKKDCPSILRHLKNQKIKTCVAYYTIEEIKQFEFDSNQIYMQNKQG